jgi:hypothetical protein
MFSPRLPRHGPSKTLEPKARRLDASDVERVAEARMSALRRLFNGRDAINPVIFVIFNAKTAG